ncbi:hypothetical protein J5690_03605 [bacterium]|nr:hypothetical protein [bacterium]
MNKKILILLISDIVMIAAFGFIMYENDMELERLKSVSETYAKENESLKIDLEILRKKLLATEMKNETKANDFNNKQLKKFKAMKEEIARLKAVNTPQNREREEQVWDYTLENIKNFVDIELTKKLASFGFKPEETAICVEEYKNSLEKSKDVLLQWYRNEITDTEYEEKAIQLSREFYKDLSASVGENLASITLSVVLPDYEFRKKIFEE